MHSLTFLNLHLLPLHIKSQFSLCSEASLSPCLQTAAPASVSAEGQRMATVRSSAILVVLQMHPIIKGAQMWNHVSRPVVRRAVFIKCERRTAGSHQEQRQIISHATRSKCPHLSTLCFKGCIVADCKFIVSPSSSKRHNIRFSHHYCGQNNPL